MIAPAAQVLSTAATAVPPAAAAGKPSSPAAGVRDALAAADKVIAVASKAVDVLDAATGASGKKRPATGYAKPATASKSKASSSTKKSATSSSAKTAAKKASPPAGPLAFLEDPRLSVEEKLVRLLGWLNERWEKEMQQKMDEIAGKGGPAATATAAAKPKKKKKSGGLLGAVADIAGAARKFFPQVGIAVDALRSPAVRAVVAKIGGPVLAAAATALGFPALAPALLRYGPAVVDVAAGLASAFAEQAGESQGAASSGSTAAEPGGAMSDRQMQMKLMEVQRLMDQQKEMFSLVSNMLRSGHDARMAVIHNVR